MENKRIKSALEIALERAERLGRVSDEELRRQDEEKHLLIGKGLADRYFVGLPIRDVEEHLSRYAGTARETVKIGYLDALTEAIQPGAGEEADISLRAILHFATTEQAKEVARNIERVQHDYKAEKEGNLASRREEVESEAVVTLAERGIAGSAIRPNIDVHESWLSAQAEFDAVYEERLAPLRQGLRNAIRGQ